EAGWTLVGRPVADHLADGGRAVRAVALRALAGAPGGARRGAVDPPRDVPQPPARRRPADVLLPVPDTGGHLLRRAAVPVGLPRAVGDRHRDPDPAPVGDAPDR